MLKGIHMAETSVACPRYRDTGIVHYLRDQGKPRARYVPVMGNPACDCERSKRTGPCVPDEPARC